MAMATRAFARRVGAFPSSLQNTAQHSSPLLCSWQSQRRSISSDGSPDQPQHGVSHWSSFGYPYMIKRCVGIASRVMGRWSEFIDYYENGLFARRSSDEDRSRMFVLTCMPRATTVDLFEFMTGATHAVRMVYGELYAESARYPEISVDKLEEIANERVLSVFTRKPLRQTQQLAVQAEPRRTRLVLEKLDIREVGLLSVDYQMHALTEEQAKERGYKEEEWLRMEVAYDVVEHVRVSGADDTVAIDDHKTFETTFTWTFESPVSDPELVDWKIINASEFVDNPAIVKATERRPVG